MSDFKITTPVAFIIFNRPDKTERVFAEIARAKPPKLLVIADGAGLNRPGETEKVAATRAIINRVDWDCQVLTNYSEVNLGCKRRVSSGIDWVFNQVEEAIILEDDCLPESTFFRFCQEMLERYRNDQRIGMISGSSFLFDNRVSNDSYYFSKYFMIWGWATWKDRWLSHYDVDMKKWPLIKKQNFFSDFFFNKKDRSHWTTIFDRTHSGLIDSWAYLWYFDNLIIGRMSINPESNLISNIGHGLDATHTTHYSLVSNIPTVSIKFPLRHPTKLEMNHSSNKLINEIYFQLSINNRIKNKLLRFKLRIKNKVITIADFIKNYHR